MIAFAVADEVDAWSHFGTKGGWIWLGFRSLELWTEMASVFLKQYVVRCRRCVCVQPIVVSNDCISSIFQFTQLTADDCFL
jgi:hypothetical protein